MRRYMDRIGSWFRAYAGASGAYGAGLRYMEHGDFRAAVEAFADAQRHWLRERGPWHSGVVMAMAKRAACYVRLGRLRDGIRLYERTLMLERGMHGEHSERVLAITAELEDARALQQRARALMSDPGSGPLAGERGPSGPEEALRQE